MQQTLVYVIGFSIPHLGLIYSPPESCDTYEKKLSSTLKRFRDRDTVYFRHTGHKKQH